MSNNKNLVIIPAGDDAIYLDEWNDKDNRNFDLFVIYYGNDQKISNKHKESSDYFYEYSALAKLKVIKGGLLKNKHLLKQYDYFFMPDDDIRISVSDVNRLFEIAKEYNLEICQPSCVGHVNLPFTAQKKEFKLRYVDAMEAMMPCFSKKALHRLLRLFTYNISMWGTEVIWSFSIGTRQKKLAVIDEIAGEHTKEMGHNYQRFYDIGVNPQSEADEIFKIYLNDLLKLGYEKPYHFYLKDTYYDAIYKD